MYLWRHNGGLDHAISIPGPWALHRPDGTSLLLCSLLCTFSVNWSCFNTSTKNTGSNTQAIISHPLPTLGGLSSPHIQNLIYLFHSTRLSHIYKVKISGLGPGTLCFILHSKPLTILAGIKILLKYLFFSPFPVSYPQDWKPSLAHYTTQVSRLFLQFPS